MLAGCSHDVPLLQAGQSLTAPVKDLRWGPRLKLELYNEPEQYDLVMVSNVQADCELVQPFIRIRLYAMCAARL